ncbi:ABC transporter ATP-binding protein [Metamycoplasma orale]|uniref:ABC transporter ATP-binding protein n=1 Tax=Metamycoplasma orale TaxID=2121 RepID=A0A448ZXN2_METOS|nr:ABC transporter ATP-binding protein [Metamycoplasma orale]VEU56037.1 ABC transporter ATP-binding protein [Metamycoplasma orale]
MVKNKNEIRTEDSSNSNKSKSNIINKIVDNYKVNNEYKKKALEVEKQIEKAKDDIAISIQHVTKIFQNTLGQPFRALDDISFEVKKGEFHGFIGNNGAGKTTTIRMILNYYKDGYGKIFINGIDSINKKSKDRIGYIPEISVFPKNLTIFEYLYYFAKLSKLSTKEAKEKVNSLMIQYGFSSKEFNKSAEKLSSGQKKKILLMQAMLNDPDILIMDEPAANLDPSARIEFYEAISKLHKQGKTILMSSHILAELEKYIDSFTVLENGKVKDSGKISEKIRNKEFNYKINSTNNALLFKKLELLKFNIFETKNSILIKLNNIEEKIKIYQIAKDNNIDILDLQENKLSLNQIYFNSTESE